VDIEVHGGMLSGWSRARDHDEAPSPRPRPNAMGGEAGASSTFGPDFLLTDLHAALAGSMCGRPPLLRPSRDAHRPTTTVADNCRPGVARRGRPARGRAAWRA
jgi:hypothetical protein